MRKTLLFLILYALLQPVYAQRRAVVKETTQTLKTYPFSDPDPVANPSNSFYPYFRFDGFSAKGIDKQWKVVSLENDYIQVTLFPEIGGKVWGAVDKVTQQEFIYNNHVVKFRDIAMRGAWTSGGIEFNFGIIGHAPTSSTPVDYLIKDNTDGSVSCYISSYELLTRTWWTVEVNLPADKAYFTTKTTWYNGSSVNQPYYHWMNAGYKADGNLEFCYPGTDYIGHDGESHPFPIDEQGRDVAWYEKNNFGKDKSYHVLGKYNDFYGAYWHDDDFGSIHHADYDEKLGMKIFLWGLSREGAIWEELLTDTDGQYVELQSGRMFNQPVSTSSYTPYKHTAFAPQATDSWVEYWFPIKGTKGVRKASRIGAFNLLREDNYLKLYFSPLQQLTTTMRIYDGDKIIRSIPMATNMPEVWKDSIPLQDVAPGKLKVVIGDDLLVYSEVPSDNNVNRPQKVPSDFDWNSVYGLYVQGEQYVNQKMHEKAESCLKASLDKEPYFMPALTCLASLYYRQGRYEDALEYCKTALSINTYEGDANYLYGLCNKAIGNNTDAKDGFSIATHSVSVRSAAYEKLAEMYLSEQNWTKAGYYAEKSIEFNAMNLNARHMRILICRKAGQQEKANALIASLLEEQPLYHPARFEKYLSGSIDNAGFTALVRNELPFETYMELAEWYESVGCLEEASTLLAFAADYPIANYKAAYLLHKQGKQPESTGLLEKANAQSPELVFPFRPGTLKALEWAKTVRPDWKISYYEGLIHWANQDKGKALSLLNECEPDYAPFYLSRALLQSGGKQLADLLKAEQLDTSWRAGLALINYYMVNNSWQQAAETGKKYMKRYPSNYYVGLKYAKVLCETGQYQPCLSLLGSLQVLPNEGSYAGREVYRAANLYQAMEQLERKNYKRALRYIDASKEWPENLGVGKPYEELIDSRLENYLTAKACAGLGEKQKADALLHSVAAYKTMPSRFGSGDLLVALALRESGNEQEANRLVSSWQTNHPSNRIAQWCASVYKGEKEEARKLLSTRTEDSDTAPWEASTRDSNFDLLVRLFPVK